MTVAVHCAEMMSRFAARKANDDLPESSTGRHPVWIKNFTFPNQSA
jgi:hypothetical protein